MVSPWWMTHVLEATRAHAKFTFSSKDRNYQVRDYCGGIVGIYLKSKKSNAVIVSKIENCSTSNFRIIEILFIRVITFSMFLSSLTCRKSKGHNQTVWCSLYILPICFRSFQRKAAECIWWERDNTK